MHVKHVSYFSKLFLKYTQWPLGLIFGQSGWTCVPVIKENDNCRHLNCRYNSFTAITVIYFTCAILPGMIRKTNNQTVVLRFLFSSRGRVHVSECPFYNRGLM